MMELSNAEALELSALLVSVGRPHSPDEAQRMEAWILRLNRGRRPDTHGGDLMQVFPLH